MQKVRKHLLAKQEGQAKSERMKQLREQRKLGKQLQVCKFDMYNSNSSDFF